MSKRSARHWLLALAVFLVANAAAARKNPLVVFPTEPESWPAMRYSTLDTPTCLEELATRGIRYARADKIPTIDAPVTLEGDLRGVRFEFAYALPEKSKKRALDCRLLLALDDFATIAKAHGIAVVRYNSAYRGRWARVRGQRHVAGVAIDITEFVKHDGEVLNVLRDFDGDGVGANTCSVPSQSRPGSSPGSGTSRVQQRPTSSGRWCARSTARGSST